MRKNVRVLGCPASSPTWSSFREKEAGTSHCRCYIDPFHKLNTRGSCPGTKSYEAPLPLAAEATSTSELPPQPAPAPGV